MINIGERHNLTLELFPFISLFLCVIGVLSFLQNLLVMGQAGDVEQEALQRQIYQTAFVFVCEPGQLIIHPPQADLDALSAEVAVDEQFGIEEIRRQRASWQARDGLVLPVSADFDTETLQQILFSIITLNHLATIAGYGYEEYVLFDIKPGGSDLFHFVRNLLDTPEFQQVRYGLTTHLDAGIAGSRVSG